MKAIFSLGVRSPWVEHYGKLVKILHGCPFEGWPTRARPFRPFWQKGLGWPCPITQFSPQKDTCAGFCVFFHKVLLDYYHKTSKNWRPILPSYISGLSHSAVCDASSKLWLRRLFIRETIFGTIWKKCVTYGMDVSIEKWKSFQSFFFQVFDRVPWLMWS